MKTNAERIAAEIARWGGPYEMAGILERRLAVRVWPHISGGLWILYPFFDQELYHQAELTPPIPVQPDGLRAYQVREMHEILPVDPREEPISSSLRQEHAAWTEHLAAMGAENERALWRTAERAAKAAGVTATPRPATERPPTMLET